MAKPMAQPEAQPLDYTIHGAAYCATYGPDWLALTASTGLRPIYARRLGWRLGPSGELSCDSSFGLVEAPS